MTGSASGAATDGLALSVHGPAGVVDLLVPAGASATDVATEYADQAGLAAVPALYTRLGERLRPDRALEDVGIGSGSYLVALGAGATPSQATGGRRRPNAPVSSVASTGEPGALSIAWFCVSAGLAATAGWVASQQAPSDLRSAVVLLLLGAALVGVVPVGRFTAHRILAAPAFAAAAAFVVAWDPAPERLPTIVGVAALSGAVTAAVARALDPASEEALRVWVVAGVSVFLVTCGAALLDLQPQVAWAVLLLVALLAARFVPMLAIEVPDQFLIDLERLAVTAWSARDRPRGRRGRTVVPSRAVEAVAVRGSRIVTAASVAVLLVVVTSAPLLVATATQRHDGLGARCMVGLTGAALLLAARSHRHPPARWLLRVAGLSCLLVVAVVVLADAGRVATLTVAITAIVLALVLVLVSVALGRGWRSARWARRAEVAESLCGAGAVGSVVVAVGLFRHLWELTS